MLMRPGMVCVCVCGVFEGGGCNESEMARLKGPLRS